MGISGKDALHCFRSEDLIGIGMEAHAVRRELLAEGVVSYLVAARIHCGVDVAGVCGRVAQAVARGATSVELVGFAPDAVTLDGLRILIAEVRQQFPGVWMEALPAGDVCAVAAEMGIGVAEALRRLRDAGLDSISGGLLGAAAGSGGGRVAEAAAWRGVHRAAHGLGMRTRATMLFGAGETVEERVELLEAVRLLQEETGGFSAFVPLSAEAGDVAAGAEGWEEPTGVEYLKTLAISRMMLDNIEHVQGSWETQGLKVLQMALRFGADDVGSVGLGEGVALGSGATEEELRRIIRDAGFRPVARDASFGAMFWD